MKKTNQPVTYSFAGQPPLFVLSLRDSRRNGSGLIIVMCILAIVSLFIGIAIDSTSTTARMSARARNYAAVEKATEGAVEQGFGIWKARIISKNSPLTTAEANANLTGPAFSDMSYAPAGNNGPLAITATDEYGSPATTPTRLLTTLLSYPGYQGYSYRYLVTAKMRQTGGFGVGAEAGVKRRVEYTEVPLFQSMFFFEGDLTIAQPAEMIVSGLVHTNSNLYLNGSTVGSLTIAGNASYSGTYSDTDPPPLIETWGPWAPSAKLPPIYPNGQDEQLSKVSRMEPLGDKPSAVLDDTDNNPNNDSFRELIEPPNPSFPDPPEIAKRRLYNKAGIRMNIDTTLDKKGNRQTNVTIETDNGTSLNKGREKELEKAVSTSYLYDQREGKVVDVANIDMGAVTDALKKGGVNNFNGVLYVNDTTSDSVDSNPKTIRLQNGGVLPDGGLTVASENPVYIQGDYNTGTEKVWKDYTNSYMVPANYTGNPNNTDSPVISGYESQPASVVADAVMLLSNSWDDNNSYRSLDQRVASNTTYNTAIMSGFMPSGYTPPNGGAPYGYSGGAINFPRFLETWNNKSCTYYGSMVELFASKTFTGEWDTGNIYAPPKRRWNFDTKFSSTPPPGSLDAVVITRGSWAKF